MSYAYSFFYTRVKTGTIKLITLFQAIHKYIAMFSYRYICITVTKADIIIIIIFSSNNYKIYNYLQRQSHCFPYLRLRYSESKHVKTTTPFAVSRGSSRLVGHHVGHVNCDKSSKTHEHLHLKEIRKRDILVHSSVGLLNLKEQATSP